MKTLPGVALVLLSCILASCRPSYLWSGSVTSPDSKFIATAQTTQDDNSFSGETETTVYLNWKVDSQPKSLILAFSDGPTAEHMDVRMRWIDSTHLSLTYSGKRTLDFAATQCAGVKIDIQNADPNASY